MICSFDEEPLESVALPSTAAARSVPPTCNGDFNSEAAAQRRLLKQKITLMAKTARTKGSSFGEIETELIKLGMDRELMREVMMEVEGKTAQAMAEKNDLNMRHGLYWLLGGLLVTLVTYGMARGSECGVRTSCSH